MDQKTTQKYLKDRLQRACEQQNVFRSWGMRDVKLPKPSSVVEAQKRIKRDTKTVERFNKKQERFNEQRKAKKVAAYRVVEKAVYFGSPREALKALEKFEKAKF